ncbi:hypothetical protein GCM10011491_22380 [Brucella endophytica]|uniref:Uncharacterized protein n=1 Tax=Brucella endophytica TaxID=1963359 RepID=A0A916SCU4_9HYPH|nr:hypothetical protein GCM10011491_22380 [Brucella endophytica]
MCRATKPVADLVSVRVRVFAALRRHGQGMGMVGASRCVGKIAGNAGGTVPPLCPAGHLPHKGGDWLGGPVSLIVSAANKVP